MDNNYQNIDHIYELSDNNLSTTLVCDENERNLCINTINTQSSTYQITHSTQYIYQKKLDYSINSLRLNPQNNVSQQIHEWNIQAPGNLKQSIDGFGNICHQFNLFYPSEHIIINANGLITTNNINLIPCNDLEIDPCFYLQNFDKSIANSEMQIFALEHTAKYKNKYEKAISLMQAIYNYVEYKQYSTNTETSAQQAFTQQSGVCQDHSHIFLACARSIGMAARYVSGYFYSPEHKHLSSHAWVDILISSSHWLSLDITNNITTNDKHIRIAVGPEYKNIAPIKGVQLGGEFEKMMVEINIKKK